MSEDGRLDDRATATSVVWAGESAEAGRLADVDGVDVRTVSDADALAAAAGDADVCVVDGDPPPSLRATVERVSVPVVVYADVDPGAVADVGDDFVRRRGDDVERLVDRIGWHAADRGDGADRAKVEQLHDIATELLACREPDAVYDIVIDAAERVLAFDICTVDAVEDGQLVPKAISEGMADDGYDAPPVEEGGLAGEAHRDGESSVVDDIRDCEAADPVADEYRSALTVPIGEAAVLQAGSTAVGAFDDQDRELAELLAAHAEGTLHRIRSEQAIRDRRETIERLHGIVARMVACDDEPELYDLLVEAAEEVLEFSLCVVMTAEPDRETLRVRAASDDSLAPEVGAEAPPDRGLYGKTYRRGESTTVEAVAARDDVDPHDERYGSALSVPLGDLGVVQAISTEAHAFDDHDLEMAELLASQAGTVLERLRADARLRTERDRLRSLFEHVPDPAVSYDFDDGTPIVRDVNSAFEAVFGYDQAAVVGQNVDDVIVPAEDRAEADEFNERFQAGDSFQQEVRRTTASGEVRDFIIHVVPTERSTGNVAGYSIYTDITDRKRRERRLDDLNRTTRELLGATDADAVCEIAVAAARQIIDLPVTGVFRREDDRLVLAAASAGAWDLFDGPPPTFEPGDDVWETFEAGDPRLFEDVQPRELVDDAPVDTTMVVPLGEYGILVSAGPGAGSFDEGTRDIAGVLAANVEAALSRAERERRLRDREQELARQNDRLEEFASVVSHDLRSPLSVARGHLDLAREDVDHDSLAKIADAHERMDALIEDLLTLAREGRVVGETEAVDLADAAEAAWRTAGSGDATLTVAEPGAVDADADRLAQLLENLFRNAVDHGGSEVTVEVGALGDGAADGFYVADDGPGIPEDHRADVFERGFTTDDGGTGFGLAIVREIADAHGWSVQATESDSGGARFEIRTQ